jgi:citrate synthase
MSPSGSGSTKGTRAMATLVRDLMSEPAITCRARASLAEAARTMSEAGTGSVVVTESAKVIGILTERDLLRAAAAGAEPESEPTRLWMTVSPDVLGPDEEAGAAWASLTHHHYRHLPVVEGDALLGVVSLRDLMRVARLRPAAEVGVEVPRGLEGVVVAETAVGDVRGREGFYHYRQYSAVDLASSRSFEDVWHLLLDGSLPARTESERFSQSVRRLRQIPPALAELLPAFARQGEPLDVLRTSVSLLGAELAWQPTHDIDLETLRLQALRLGSVVPTIVAATFRLRAGLEPVAPRDDLGHAANYLWMMNGEEAGEARVRAVEQYMILTIDHGFNASTFAARVIVSTGADLAAAQCGAIGALSGPLHGGAPSRALDMLDQIRTPDRADDWLRAAIESGDRIMGFGHRLYRTEDPRSAFLRGVAESIDAPAFGLAAHAEKTAIRLLVELKPERELCTNVEFYAGVVMSACGIAPEMFTPTFAVARTVGWSAHVLEQAGDNRLIRPAALYAGPAAPQPVPVL